MQEMTTISNLMANLRASDSGRLEMVLAVIHMLVPAQAAMQAREKASKIENITASSVRQGRGRPPFLRRDIRLSGPVPSSMGTTTDRTFKAHEAAASPL
jgi:hypothetical protein